MAAAETPPPAPPIKQNKGWFRPGHDARRNPEGRPRGSKGPPPAQAKVPELRAERTDRVMWFGYLTKWLREHLHPFGRECTTISNLPADYEIVGCRVYHNGYMAVIVRSKRFPRVARGAMIPEFAKQQQRRRFALVVTG